MRSTRWSPDTPVFVMHLYDRVLLNRAALRAVGYHKRHPGSSRRRDSTRQVRVIPRVFCWPKPNANILYSTLAKGPKLSREDQLNSSRLFFRELNRFGITSAIDAGGGFQNYPDDYGVVNELHKKGELSIRLAYNLFTQKPKQELADFQNWTKMTKPGEGDDFYRVNGAGEMLVFSAADFEDFLQPRPGHGACYGERVEGGDSSPRGKPMAIPHACHIRRNNLSGLECLRGG